MIAEAPPEPVVEEPEPADEETDENGDKVDPKDVFRRVPNRQERRDSIRLRGEVQLGRSRIRRRINRIRRYYEGK